MVNLPWVDCGVVSGASHWKGQCSGSSSLWSLLTGGQHPPLPRSHAAAAGSSRSGSWTSSHLPMKGWRGALQMSENLLISIYHKGPPWGATKKMIIYNLWGFENKPPGAGAGCPFSASPGCSAPPPAGCYSAGAPGCSHTPWTGCPPYSETQSVWSNRPEMPIYQEQRRGKAPRCSLTWPVLVESMVQSGMVLDSWTIQLLILSLLLRSTERQTKLVQLKDHVDTLKTVPIFPDLHHSKQCVVLNNLISSHLSVPAIIIIIIILRWWR